MKRNYSKTVSLLALLIISFSALFAVEDDMQFHGESGIFYRETGMSLGLLPESVTFQQPFSLSPLTDGIIGGTTAALAGSAFLCDKVFHIKKNNTGDFAPFPLDKNSLNGFDRPFIQHYSKTLDHVGDGVLALTMALPALMFTSNNTDWLTVGVMYAETLALAYGMKQWGKLLITRPRPYMYFDDYPQGEVDRGDWHCSFPSGHTTIAFTAAAFTSAVFNEYFPDTFWRHVVTAGSFGLATAVGIIRMSSGNHFATDVLAGVAIGTLCGFIVPFFHSNLFINLVGGNKNTEVAVSPLGFNVRIRLD